MDGFYAGDEEGLVTLGKTGCTSPFRGALLMPFLVNWKGMAETAFFGAARVRGIRHKRLRSTQVPSTLLYETHRGNASWLTAICPLGAPCAAASVEMLDAAGVQTLLFFGFCGSLTQNIPTGALILPSEAIREEGTSYHYVQSGEPSRPSAPLTGLVAARLAEANLSFTQGPIWTTDALFRETPMKIRRHREAGVLAVEMETSAVLAVWASKGKQACALLGVTDVLTDSSWTGFSALAGLGAWDRLCQSRVLDLLGEAGE